MERDYEIIYSLKDATYQPSTGFIIAALIGLIIFFVMLFSFIDLKKYMKPQIRLWLLGISIFGLLQFGSLHSEYRAYKTVHEALIGRSNEVVEGSITNYQKNNRGLKTFVVGGVEIETGESFTNEIFNGDSVKIEYYKDAWNRHEIVNLEWKMK